MVSVYFTICFSVVLIFFSGLMLGAQLYESFDAFTSFCMIFAFIVALVLLFSIPYTVKQEVEEEYIKTKTCSVCEYKTTDENTAYCPYDGSKLLTNSKEEK